MINILFNDKTYGACLEKLVYTNNAEYAKTIIAEMNKEADYDKYYGLKVTKDWRGREIKERI